MWEDNPKIRNPHLIYPGDLVWLNRYVLRHISEDDLLGLMLDPPEPEPASDPQETASDSDDTASDPGVMASEPEQMGPQEQDGVPDPLDFMPEPELPAAWAAELSPVVTEGAPDPFAALDQGEAARERVLHYPGLHRFGFVSADQLAGSAAVLGSHEENYWSAQLQRTVVGLGEGQVHIGDAFTVYRIRRRVLHPNTGRVMGFFTQILGRVEISEIHPEASYVRVVTSYVEIEPGDRITPYIEPPLDLPVKQLDEPIKGTIIAQQPYRQYSAWHDFVILDRGAGHGLEPGNQLTIYREGREVRDPLTGARVLVPDDVIGQLFIVKVAHSTSVGLITRSRRKIHEGDRFRNL